jgi:hypothetical protein
MNKRTLNRINSYYQKIKAEHPKYLVKMMKGKAQKRLCTNNYNKIKIVKLVLRGFSIHRK